MSPKIACVFCLISFLSLLFAQTFQENEARLMELEKRCQTQQAQLRELEQQLENCSTKDPEAYTQKIVQQYLEQSQAQEDGETLTAGYEEGFFIRSSDGDYELKFTGFAQFGIGIFENNTFDNDTFFPNNVYLIFDFTFFEKWHAHIEADFADTESVKMYDAYLEYMAIPELNFLVGHVYVPFSLTGEHYAYALNTIFYEPFVYSFDHGYDMGFYIYGVLADMFSYDIGIFNDGGTMTMHNDDDFMFATRFRWYFLGNEKNPDTFLHFAFMRARRTESDVDNRDAVIWTGWGRQVFDGDDVNPHADKYGSDRTNESTTRGWRTSFDLGLRWSHDFENGSNLRVEIEGMHITWNRELTTGRLAPLQLWGGLVSVAYRHSICPEIEQSGIIPALAFSYTDIDNKSTNDTGDAAGPVANIRGQRVYNYTIGLGYAFNKHLKVNFNWIIMDLDNDAMNPSKDKEETGHSLEHAWFLQATATW